MKTYNKIQTVFKRDSETNYKTLLIDEYARPEFGYLKNNQWVFTEKVDGTNIRVIYDGEFVRFAGKTDRAQMYPGMYECLEKLFRTDFALKNLNKIFGETPTGTLSVCLYGEGYGAGIQKGGCYRSDKGFVLFDIWVNGWWLKREDVIDIADQLDIDVVPVIGIGTLPEMVKLVEAGFNSQYGKFEAEGIVARPVVELHARNGQRIITKLKCKDFKGVKNAYNEQV